jgi:hypothetical protein
MLLIVTLLSSQYALGRILVLRLGGLKTFIRPWSNLAGTSQNKFADDCFCCILSPLFASIPSEGEFDDTD